MKDIHVSIISVYSKIEKVKYIHLNKKEKKINSLSIVNYLPHQACRKLEKKLNFKNFKLINLWTMQPFTIHS